MQYCLFATLYICHFCDIPLYTCICAPEWLTILNWSKWSYYNQIILFSWCGTENNWTGEHRILYYVPILTGNWYGTTKVKGSIISPTIKQLYKICLYWGCEPIREHREGLHSGGKEHEIQRPPHGGSTLGSTC